MVRSEKFRRASDDGGDGRMFFEGFFQKIANIGSLPAQRMFKISVKRQIALIKIMCDHVLRLDTA